MLLQTQQFSVSPALYDDRQFPGEVLMMGYLHAAGETGNIFNVVVLLSC